MKNIKVLITLLILFSFTISVNAQFSRTFKKEAFDEGIKNLVEPNVMGYQYVLIKDGKFVTEGAGGKARTGTDGNLKMTTSTPQNIGSLAKFLSGTAMINLFEKPAAKADREYKERGLKGSLSMPVWGEFPKVWLNVIPGPFDKGPQLRNFTFRQLLQHRSGFYEEFKKS